MEFLKLFESFDLANHNDNDKLWVIGIPSGEALLIEPDVFNRLYKRGYISWNDDYVPNFYCFSDRNLEMIKSGDVPESPNTFTEYLAMNGGDKSDMGDGKSYIFMQNMFPQKFLEELKKLISNREGKITMIADGRMVKIKYNSPTGHSSLIQLKRNINEQQIHFSIFRDNVIIEEYLVVDMDIVIKRVKKEMDVYFK